MKLHNPPVIQTWVGFAFEPALSSRCNWTLEAADEFLSRFESSLPRRETVFETSYEIQELSPRHRPRVFRNDPQLDRVRARNEQGTEWLQLARDRMVYNRTRGEGAYLGYSSLRDEAIKKLSEYVAFFQPRRLRSAELHYVDLIEIPRPPSDQSLNLQDYFLLRVEVPGDEGIGTIASFSTRLFLRPPLPGVTVEIRFQNLPPTAKPELYRFRIDWHLVLGEIASFDPVDVGHQLDEAHDYLSLLFKASLTDKTWAMFQPDSVE